ncbi:MAG: hypothetical protein K2Y23_21165 [Cyanobacteria bacterium]|nr:hypothetical protein [Cyanobacteriota bacterium]
MGAGLTTLERLDAWKEAGVITDDQHALLSAIVRRDRFSFERERHALLYGGVIVLVAGMALLIRG